ncbi:tail tape measure protein TP901 core region [Stappia sp. 22II-S9-Z10]|nr:tail tape measure protein TP901 core region [Stappia sp. 22II-S9-Z10]
MTDDSEGLAVAVQANLKDFNRAMGQIETRIHGMEKKINSDMRKVETSTRRAARKMEQEFSQATVGVAGKIRSLRTMTGDARSMLGGAFGAISAIGPGTGVLGAVGGVAAGAALAGIVRQSEAIADLRAEAERAGLTFQDFQSLKFSFEQERVSIDALTDGFKELQLRADEFIKTGKGSGEEMFNQLGYSATELARRLEDPKELFFDIIDRMRNMKRSEQIRIFDEMFGGTGGEQFMQLMSASTDELRRSAEFAERNVNLTDEMGEKAERVAREFATLGDVIGNAISSRLVDVGDVLVDIGKTMKGLVESANEYAEAMSRGTPERRLREYEQDLVIGQENQRALQAGREAAAAATFGQNIDLGIPQEYLDTLEEQTHELENHEETLARIGGLLARANEISSLSDAERGGEKIEEMRRLSEELKNELVRAAAEMLRLGQYSDAVAAQMREMAFPTTAPPGIGPSGSAGAVPTDLGRRVSSQNVNVAGLKPAVTAAVTAVLSQFPELRVSSAYRSPEYNARVGGARNSRHTHGDAVDLIGVNAQNVAAIVGALQSQGFRGFGYYNNGSLHADMGARRAWGPDRTSGSLGRTPYAFQQAVAYGPSVADIPPAQRLAMSDAAYQDQLKGSEAASKAAAADSAKRDEERARRAEAIEAVNQKIREGIELQQIEAEMLKEGKLSHDEISAALEQERESRQRLDELRAAGVEVSPEMEEAIRREIALKHELIAANDRLRDANESQLERIGELKDAFASLGESALDDFFAIIEGSKSAEDAIKGLVKQMAKMALQGALFGSGPLGQFFGGGLLGGFGKRASGGPVSAGHVYQVNEGGPELFVPNQSGRIIDASRTAAALNAAGRPFQKAGGSTPLFSITNTYNGETIDTRIRQVAGPMAEAAAGRHADNVRSEVPSMVDARNHQRETRRTGTIRSRRGLA